MRGEIRFDVDIPADLERRMRLLEALRAVERKILLPRQTDKGCKCASGNRIPRHWSAEEDERLVMMYSDNMSLRYIAHMLNRSEAAVRRRLSALHLPRKK